MQTHSNVSVCVCMGGEDQEVDDHHQLRTPTVNLPSPPLPQSMMDWKPQVKPHVNVYHVCLLS